MAPVVVDAGERRVEKLLYTMQEAGWALGSVHVVTLCERAGWLERVPGGGRLKMFRGCDVVEAYHRILNEGLDQLKALAAEGAGAGAGSVG